MLNKFSNKQNLVFFIVKYNIDNTVNVQFEIDNSVKENINFKTILDGRCYHSDLKTFKINSRTKKYYHVILEQALKFNFKIDFLKEHKELYRTAYDKGWLNDICSHMDINTNIKWTKDKCKIEALKYSYKKDFKYFNSGAYNSAFLNGWLNDICSHMVNANIKWTIKKCKNFAIKCKTRKEFSDKYPNAYDAAIRRGWIDIVCFHMQIIINALDSPRIIYCYEFDDKSIYIGLTKNFKRRHYYRQYKNNDCVMNHIKNTGLQPTIKFLTEFIPAEEAQLKEQEFIDKYRNEGFKILNKIKAGSLGGSYQLIKL